MKKVLVTGGTRGIGAAISKSLAAIGYHVYINCRVINEVGENLCAEIRSSGGSCQLINFNLTDKNTLMNAINEISSEKLDIIINNAGILKDNLIPSTEIEDWNDILKTNMWGVIDLYNLFLQNKIFNDNAIVINMGSISGVRPRAGQGAYAVSKAMIIEWTKEIAQRDKNITFYAVSPGPVATEMIKKAPWYTNPKAFDRIPMKRFAEPEEIANLISFLVTERPMKSGENIIIDGGFLQTTRGE